MDLIIIAGMPATGKSTLAKKLSDALGIAILEKDEIKDEMFDTIGFKDRKEKRALDVAANAILLRCTEKLLDKGNSLIIVNNFDSDMSGRVQEMIDKAGCKCVTVFLNGDPEVLYKRYVARDAKHVRHMGHTFIDRYPPLEGDDVNRNMTREYFRDRFEKHGMADFKLNGNRIDLDATFPNKIDVDKLISDIKEALK